MASAVIVRARLPPGLERLRLRSVGDAGDGVPAHLTMLYPFLEPPQLDSGVRDRLAAVAGRFEPFAYRLAGPARWPDTVYVAVDPVEPFVRLQTDLQAAFPDWPIYGEPTGFEFVPHVTVAEGDPVALRATVTDPAWRRLPITATARALEVIATRPDGRWRLVWRIPLGRGTARPAARMRP